MSAHALRLPPLAVTLLALAGCGNARQQGPSLTHVPNQGPLLAYQSPSTDVSFAYPKGWYLAPGNAPEVAQIEAGSALAAIYEYPRTDLPSDAAGVAASRQRLITSLRRRAPGFRLSDTKITQVADAPAVEVRGAGRVGSERVRTLSVHIYRAGAEYVVDAYAAPAVFAKAKATAFDPLLETLHVRSIPMLATGGAAQGGATGATGPSNPTPRVP